MREGEETMKETVMVYKLDQKLDHPNIWHRFVG